MEGKKEYVTNYHDGILMNVNSKLWMRGGFGVCFGFFGVVIFVVKPGETHESTRSYFRRRFQRQH